MRKVKHSKMKLQQPNTRHNKALHPTAYSSVRFSRKLPSLSPLLAAGELGRYTKTISSLKLSAFSQV